MIGKIISHYKIIEELGRGGMGVVYKARDTKLDRDVALKFLPAQFSADPEERKRFIHEAKAAAALNHPNIVTIHEIGDHEGQIFIAMEYVAGRTLKDIVSVGTGRDLSLHDAVPLPLAPRPLPLAQVLDIATQLASGLAAAHAKGIVHRDLKPANIMLTEQGVAKIVDFGLAKLKGMSRLTRSGTTLGTVAYMSPEQALGKEVDQRSDIWSLGVILYEMLTNKLPFPGEYEQAMLYAVINEEPESVSKLRSDIPDELKRIVRKALAKNPEKRYQTTDELLKELKRVHREIAAPESVAFNFRRFFFRVRILVPALVILCLFAAAMAFYLKHQAKVRWAEKEALPQAEKLIEENDSWRGLLPVYQLAEKIEAVIPHHPKLAGIFAKCALTGNIRTDPPGARIYMKEYMAPTSEWEYLGVSPLEKIRLPVGVFRWKMEKEGYETVLAAATTYGIDWTKPDLIIPCDLVRLMDKKGTIPQGMVRVAGVQRAKGKLDDFFIDRYEVTNRQYKEFINAGGYRNRKFWKERFVRDGKELAWEEAVKGFVDQTGLAGPAGWQAGDFPEGEGDYPVSGISWYEAAAYAEYAGKNLPTVFHWRIASGQSMPGSITSAMGDLSFLAPFSNFQGKGPVPVGSLPGITAYGAFDMAGNVREWCWNETPAGKIVSGGAWGDPIYIYDRMSQAPAMDRSAKNGFRCVFYPEPEKIPKPAFRDIRLAGEKTDPAREKPVADSIFQVYKEQFSYDKTDLKSRLESKKESPEWSLEKISFDAAYGGERVLAWLFLPRNAAPPYQTVIYLIAGGASQRSSQDIENWYEFTMFLSFLVKNGRAVLCPVCKGFFERGNDALARIQEDWTSHQFSEIFIQQVKDLRRSIDYLETRPDIDMSKLAFEGLSSAGCLAPVVLAVEGRIRASVLIGSGLVSMDEVRPEVHPLNYLPRVKTPTLMLNGKYDTGLPPDTSQQPMFALLGTPAGLKLWKLYETDHIPPRNEVIKESVAWLDKILGPVKR
jgi:tRNA A-37 threonylcarbamoyl transferase component Bud32